MSELTRRFSLRSIWTQIKEWRLVVIGATIIALSMIGFVNQANAAVSTTKSAADAVSGSGGVAQAGNPIQWVVSYGHTGPRGTMDLKDAIPKGSEFILGSLVVPPGYTKEFSTDGGTTFSAQEPASATTNIRSQGAAPPTATSVTEGLAQPPEGFVAASGVGDGMQALFFGENVYNINHHRGAGGPYRPMVQCHSKATGEDCPGFPTYASSQAGQTLGQGVDDMITPNQSWNGVNQARNRAYTPIGRANSNEIGVLCIDFSTSPGKSCGFTKLADAPIPNHNGNDGGGFAVISGGAQIANKYYVIDSESKVFCFDVNTDAVCSDWPAAGVVADPSAPIPSGNQTTRSNIQAFDGRYLIGTSTRNSGVGAICLDLTITGNDKKCPGFPQNIPNGVGAIAPILNNTGSSVTGMCVVNTTSTTDASWSCFSTSNGATTLTAPWEATEPAGTHSFGYFSGERIGSKFYFSLSLSNETTYSCWDFATNADCTGFVRATSGESTSAYSLREDPFTPGCIWEVGDSGRFEVFDAQTGGTTCERSAAGVTAEPQSFYCDGKQGHVRKWQSLRINELSASQFDSGTITLYDTAGNQVPGFSSRQLSSAEISSGVIDISGVSITGTTAKLRAELLLVGANKQAWQASSPHIQLSWEGDDIQFCYQTKAPMCTSTLSMLTNEAVFLTNDGSTEESKATASIKLAGEGCPTPKNKPGVLAETGQITYLLPSLGLLLLLGAVAVSRRL